MSSFKAYQHVCRFGTEDTEGILQNPVVYITCKLDGTNSSVWYDIDTDTICCGSRTRELNSEKDNAGFYNWMESDNREPHLIRNFLLNYPNLRLYGEWLGTSKFVGAIKDYNHDALGFLYIFDVYDNDTQTFLDDMQWRKLLADNGLEEFCIPILAVLEYPVLEDIEKIAKTNKFLLDNANHCGEGVVVRAPGWRNKYGREQYAKFVLDEYKQFQKAPKKKETVENPEQWIIENYCTEAEISKAMAKVALTCGTDTFDPKAGKQVGMLLNMVWREAILEEAASWLKKLKNPIIDFSILDNLCKNKVREYARIGY